jgi:hypothetical protein
MPNFERRGTTVLGSQSYLMVEETATGEFTMAAAPKRALLKQCSSLSETPYGRAFRQRSGDALPMRP